MLLADEGQSLPYVERCTCQRDHLWWAKLHIFAPTCPGQHLGNLTSILDDLDPCLANITGLYVLIVASSRKKRQECKEWGAMRRMLPKKDLHGTIPEKLSEALNLEYLYANHFRSVLGHITLLLTFSGELDVIF